MLCQSCRKLLPHWCSAETHTSLQFSRTNKGVIFPVSKHFLQLQKKKKKKKFFFNSSYAKISDFCCCWKNLEGGSVWKGLEWRESQPGCWPRGVPHPFPWLQPAFRWDGRCPMGYASTRLSHWFECHYSHRWHTQDPTWRPTGREEQTNHLEACKSCSSVCTQDERGGLTTPEIVQLPKPLKY